MKNEKRKNKLDLNTPVAYSGIVFIETPIFTRLITGLMDDDNYSSLQAELIRNPQKGALIVDGGGIRTGANTYAICLSKECCGQPYG